MNRNNRKCLSDGRKCKDQEKLKMCRRKFMPDQRNQHGICDFAWASGIG